VSERHAAPRWCTDGPLHIDNRCYDHLITALRAPTERSNTLLGRWRALGAASPSALSASAQLSPPRWF
jgi:hypothetical protein